MKKFIKQQKDVFLVQNIFERNLASSLNLIEVLAPLFFEKNTGEQDQLSGVEKAVSFKSKALKKEYEIVQSLAKWKRLMLTKHDFSEGYGLFADMRAVRPSEEEITDIHSMYVDQWDWEVVINGEQRNKVTLRKYVDWVYESVLKSIKDISILTGRDTEYLSQFSYLPEKIKYIHSEELLSLYPDKSPKEREYLIVKKYGAVFIRGIGAKLSNGEPHDERSPDYDDWITLDENGLNGLNGDILVWCKSIDAPLELTSMGIRVDSDTLQRQLKLKECSDRLILPWHEKLINGELKQTIGGGIGKSRMTMFLLQLPNIHDFKYLKY